MASAQAVESNVRFFSHCFNGVKKLASPRTATMESLTFAAADCHWHLTLQTPGDQVGTFLHLMNSDGAAVKFWLNRVELGKAVCLLQIDTRSFCGGANLGVYFASLQDFLDESKGF